MKRTLVAAALAVIFVMALAVPALAQALTISTTYDMEGTINFEKQAGHLCNTGAEIKQTIVGNGSMDKVQTISMIEGRITMNDVNDWVAGVTPLTVTTVWELCAPPKYVDANDVAIPVSSIYSPTAGYVVDTAWDALTDQIWAVQVQADPGFSGNIHQNGVAAHGGFSYNGVGPYPYDSAWDLPFNPAAPAYLWDFSDTWRWALNEDGVRVREVGANFVGSYFDMEQHARTSQGTLRRYIDISSPFNHGYLYEDMSVVGKSDVQETFSLKNIPAGADMPGKWWDLF